jgi:hypothetical protein
MNGDRSQGFHTPSAHSSGKHYLENIYNAVLSPSLVNILHGTAFSLNDSLITWQEVGFKILRKASYGYMSLQR